MQVMDADGNGHCRHQVIALRVLCIAGVIDELEFVEYFDRVLHMGLWVRVLWVRVLWVRVL